MSDRPAGASAPADTGHVLHSHGRDALSRAAVDGALGRAGLTCRHVEEVVLRSERGTSVHGLLEHAEGARTRLSGVAARDRDPLPK